MKIFYELMEIFTTIYKISLQETNRPDIQKLLQERLTFVTDFYTSFHEKPFLYTKYHKTSSMQYFFSK